MRSLPVEFKGRISAAAELSIERMLSEIELGQNEIAFSAMKGDGSDRIFLRVTGKDRSLVIALPGNLTSQGLNEARSAWLIGRHLHGRGVPVPEIYGFDQETGTLLCEDLGDDLLHRQVMDGTCSEEKIIKIYLEAIDLLVHMQVAGARGFSPGWCWDTSRYDRQLMLARESGYFLDACCRKLLGLADVPARIETEFVRIADHAANSSAEYFLHRDFQSRNLMIKDGRLRVIDFQGGRKGPLGYDLAALLIDPYVSLPEGITSKLFNHYRQLAADLTGTDMKSFTEDYYWLSLQRNLQILGAFAYLYKEKGKLFFGDYLKPAAGNLIKILKEPAGRRLPILNSIATELPERLDEVLCVKSGSGGY